MLAKEFFEQEEGVISAEFVVFVACIAVLLVVGVAALFNAMSGYFNAWAAFFAAGS